MSTVNRDVRQERDRVSRHLVLLAAAVVTAISVIYIAVSWALTTDEPPWADVERLSAELGVIEAVRFETETRGEEQAREERARLNSYGWVDRKRGIIHIPIHRAIDLYLQERSEGGLRSEIAPRWEVRP